MTNLSKQNHFANHISTLPIDIDSYVHLRIYIMIIFIAEMSSKGIYIKEEPMEACPYIVGPISIRIK